MGHMLSQFTFNTVCLLAHQSAGEEGIQEEQEEGLVIKEAHAVGHPHAVVVHSQHAPPQHAVVVRSLWLPCLLSHQ